MINFFFPLRLLRRLCFALLIIIGMICILFAILQSTWAKEELKTSLLSALKQAGIESTLSDLKGTPPFSWTIDNATLRFGQEEKLQLNHITLRIAILPLFKGKFAIDYIHVDQGCYFFSPKQDITAIPSLDALKQQIRLQLENLHLPCSFHLKHLSADQFELINLKTDESFSLGMTAQAKIKQDKTEFSLKLHLFSPDSHQTYLDASLDGSRVGNRIETTAQLHVDALPSFFPLQGELISSISAGGPWHSWEAALYDQPLKEAPVLVRATGSCQNTQIKNLPLTNTDWKFNTSFFLESSQQIRIKNLLLQSPQMELLAKGALNLQVDKSDFILAFLLPDLQAWMPFSLSGSTKGKAFYKAGQFTLVFETKNLKVDSFEANTVSGKLQGEITNSQLTALVSLSSEDALVPFKNTFSLFYSPEKFAVDSLDVSMGEDTLKGNLSYSFNSRLYTGTLCASIQECNRFESLFPKHRIYGQILSDLTLLEEDGKQTMQSHLSGHHIRYENILLDDLSLTCSVKDPLGTPSGDFHLLAEKIYMEGHYVEQLLLDTQSNPSALWPFSLSMQGRIETPFSWHARGNWQKKETAVSVEISEWAGNLLEIPFSLNHPTSLVFDKTNFTLNPLDLQVGQGHLSAYSTLSEEHARGELEIAHFPLEVLRCFHPRFGLNGFLSAKGSLEGDIDSLQGSLNAVLEEASISHFGKNELFQSKGSLQAHLDHNRLQIHTDLKATDAQFFDLTASLPLHYTSYPFSLRLDPDLPSSTELIAEGKVEDLFDFINLGTNHFTGLVSCRLFLSQTFQNPSLLGNLTWENGSYENYFTGLSLKSIHARFEAENTQLRLMDFTAQDDQSGTVSASGIIELKPQEQFPYHFDAELHHLHALSFDMIDCHLSGPLYLTGNLQEMLAQGNLLIDKAKIQVSERLPYEAITLPFTYIHKPPHLDSPISITRPPFLFHLDLELTAQNKVLVEGRGLSAELEGDVHLQGTNTHIAANGEFHLVKGEYIFSGKVFKLTEASVSFTDKPTPSSYLNVSGTLSLSDTTIIAMMRGPITSPQLTFQSNPHRSTSSILALILFNKDISEINQLEAVQLASTLISLSGGAGPDVLDSIRKTIGVDRLNISSGPSSDPITVQIGKYLMRGVMITLSRSATSSEIIVEVELPRGFIFQAETQVEKEGKFSLKWRKNY